VSLFLYDLREDPRPVAAEDALRRGADGRPVGRQAPTRHFRLSYLVSAWPAGRELLAAILTGCLAQGIIPAGSLVGSLAGSGLPIILSCGPAVPQITSVTLWRDLGLPARTSLDLLAVVPYVPPLDPDLAPTVRTVDLEMSNRRRQGRITE
jgi:hypothetical protein